MKTELKEIFMYVLGGLIVIGFFLMLYFLVKENIYESTINLAIGALIAAFGTIVGYFYGSSKGSADKNDLLKK
jgi:hypothetical protein